MKRSADGGRTWSGRLPVPGNWATSLETPTIHRVTDARGVKRLVVFSGLYPIRMSLSEDDGRTWTLLAPIGDFGGLTWAAPQVVAEHPGAHLCEPGAVRSPDGKQLALLLRENSRKHNSFAVFSNDEGRTWSLPVELPAALTGDRHIARYARDGRLLVVFRDTTRESATKGDWVAWVGRYEDIVKGREGQYRIRLMDNTKGNDCCYAGLERLPDGAFVTTTYGHWTEGEAPYIVNVRFTLKELDQRASK